MIFKKNKTRSVRVQHQASTRLISYLLCQQEKQERQVDKADIDELIGALERANSCYQSRIWWTKKAEHIVKLNALVESYKRLKQSAPPLNLKQLLQPVLEFIAMLESESASSLMLADLAKANVMAIIYERREFRGEIDKELQGTVNQSYWQNVLAALGVVFYLLTAIAFPYRGLMIAAGTIFSGSCAYLSTSLSTGIESLISSGTSMPYMLLGHNFTQLSVMKSNDRKAQAAAWMAITANSRSHISQVIFMSVTLALSLFLSFHAWPLIVMMLISPLMQLGVECVLPLCCDKKSVLEDYLNHYQKQGVQAMHLTNDEKKAWLRCLKRKELSQKAFYLSTALSLTSLSLATVFSTHLPFVFLTVFINSVVPVTIAATVVGVIFLAAVYLKKNQDKQVVNRYALNFEKAPDTTSAQDVESKEVFHYTKWLFLPPKARPDRQISVSDDPECGRPHEEISDNYQQEKVSPV